MKKAEGALLTISELAVDLGLPQHILRYWETRFPQLRPLQRSGNRRYYRADDVELARRIHRLLNVQGFTVKGAQKVLADPHGLPVATPVAASNEDDLLPRLHAIRAALAAAIDPDAVDSVSASPDPVPDLDRGAG